jgi:hypothetical protein
LKALSTLSIELAGRRNKSARSSRATVTASQRNPGLALHLITV